MLNPNLDLDALKAKYSEDQRLRIAHLFTEEVAGRIHEILLSKTPYEYAYVVGDENASFSTASISMEQLATLSPEQRRDLFQSIYKQAANGVGYLYGRFHLSEAKDHADDVGFLNEVYTYLNSPDMLGFIKHITQVDELQSADAQATSYRPGNFLTRHRDDTSGQQRRLAYVLGFSQSWHPDWGGLLQFFEEDGTPRDAWLPQFNTLSLFDIRHIHSVTHIAPYAAVPRLSITGWFRAAPLSE